MVKNPFKHSPHHSGDDTKNGVHHSSWLHREDAGISHGKSSLFFIAHENPSPPSVTCLQGHEILPGETSCSQGHPIG
ncbi:conserved hypothetical protein [Arthrobacter sp. 9AX]|uniref:hypothetical protein n=1 Tax=Arthrobacter sp. 9AX TaxID=2653131 RepID=UPI0012F0CFE0|nr:hypothetical protein [Arthrobacter sp. 9AX]VXB16452.1 conserved hypothetical protein [Arthrobacter sp. 9AX]